MIHKRFHLLSVGVHGIARPESLLVYVCILSLARSLARSLSISLARAHAFSLFPLSVHTHLYKHTYTHTHTHSHTLTHTTHTLSLTHTLTPYIYLHLYVHACRHACARVCVCVSVRAYYFFFGVSVQTGLGIRVQRLQGDVLPHVLHHQLGIAVFFLDLESRCHVALLCALIHQPGATDGVQAVCDGREVQVCVWPHLEAFCNDLEGQLKSICIVVVSLRPHDKPMRKTLHCLCTVGVNTSLPRPCIVLVKLHPDARILGNQGYLRQLGHIQALECLLDEEVVNVQGCVLSQDLAGVNRPPLRRTYDALTYSRRDRAKVTRPLKRLATTVIIEFFEAAADIDVRSAILIVVLQEVSGGPKLLSFGPRSFDQFFGTLNFKKRVDGDHAESLAEHVL